MFAAMPWPIRPSPINPIVGFVMVSTLHKVGANARKRLANVILAVSVTQADVAFAECAEIGAADCGNARAFKKI